MPDSPTVNLTNCDREPIHIPGSIQPHGCLIACDEALRQVRRHSQNAPAMLGCAQQSLIGLSLSDLFDREAIHQLLNALSQARAAGRAGLLLGLRLNGPTGPAFNVAAHKFKGAAILEFEPAPQGAAADPLDTFRMMIAATSRAQTIDTMLQAVPRLLHGLFGYDRVMVYRFSADESGKVIAEQKRSDLESFLGQHFPASDIPQQARALYLRNTIRIISDASGARSPILPELDASGEPLDLSFAHLRSVSPIHLEYLRNMGVGASMSISIITEGKLWGLIACHHYAPRTLSMPQRIAAELFGEFLSLQLEAMTHRARLDAAGKARRALDRMMRDISYHGDITATLRDKLDDFFAFMPCDGIGLWLGDKWSGVGVTPPSGAIEPLLAFLNSASDGKVWATHELSAHLPAAARYAERASGLLAIPLSQRAKDYLLFFRREIMQTLDWAGDPNKTYETGPMGDRLTPRKSFAIWKQQVERQSAPWSEDDREIAEATRSALLEILLRHAEIVETERQTAAVRQKLLNEELNHRVKNILALIKSLVSQPVDEGRDLGDYVSALKGRIIALAFAHDQVMRSDGGGSLRALLEAELGPYNSVAKITVEGPNVSLDSRAFSVMALVIHEMATNAAKYGALSRSTGALRVSWAIRPDGACEVIWKETGGPRVVPPTRQGFGNVLLSRSIPFDLGGEAKIDYELDGVRARFVAPARFVTLGAAAARREQATAPPQSSSPKRSVAGLKVMLVEDQLVIAMDAETTLLDCGAKSVDTAATPAEAMRLLEATTPDVCVLDVNLGAETSLAVAEALSERRVPFIFATGYADSAIIPKALAHIPTVRKPYDAETLTAAIAEVLSEGA